MRQYKITIEVGSDEEGEFKPWGHSMTALVYEDAWLAIGATAEKMADSLDNVISAGDKVEWKDESLADIVEKEAEELYDVYYRLNNKWLVQVLGVDEETADAHVDAWRKNHILTKVVPAGEKP